MAQDFSLRYPLVDGQGNFGSLDGDSAAADALHRVPSCSRSRSSCSTSSRQRPSTGGPTTTARAPSRSSCRRAFPNLLVNGSPGIAVGMATNIPPHNLGEVVDACIALDRRRRTLESKDLLKYIKGPDFPTGGQVLASQARARGDLRDRLRLAQAARRVEARGADEGAAAAPRSSSRRSRTGRRKQSIVEKIADDHPRAQAAAAASTCATSRPTDVRIVLEIKKDADPAAGDGVPLQAHAAADELAGQPDLPRADRQSRRSAAPSGSNLQRLPAPLPRLPLRGRHAPLRASSSTSSTRRIHILEGFAKIFDALDEIIRIIRKREGKEDAAREADEALQARRGAGRRHPRAQARTGWRSSRSCVIQKELAEKRKEAKRLEGLLKSDAKRWTRRQGRARGARQASSATSAGPRSAARPTSRSSMPNAFIVDEDANVVLTRDGWVKRVRELKDAVATRTREGDAVHRRARRHHQAARSVLHQLRLGLRMPRSTTSRRRPATAIRCRSCSSSTTASAWSAALSLDPRASRPHRRRTCVARRRKGGYGLRFALRAAHARSRRAPAAASPSVAEGDEVVGVRPAPDDGILVRRDAATRTRWCATSPRSTCSPTPAAASP